MSDPAFSARPSGYAQSFTQRTYARVIQAHIRRRVGGRQTYGIPRTHCRGPTLGAEQANQSRQTLNPSPVELLLHAIYELGRVLDPPSEEIDDLDG